MAHNKWYEYEIEIIISNYEKMSDEELHKLIPNHSVSSIATKRKDIGLIRPVWNKKYLFSDVQNEMTKRHYILVSQEYDFKNASSKIKYICPIHSLRGIQKTTLGHLLEGKGCIYCGYEKTALAETKTSDECQLLCQQRNFEFIENKIINNHTFIFFICKRHTEVGIQKMTYQNMKRDGYGCKYCRSSLVSKSRGEKRIKQFLHDLGINYIQQFRFNDCRDQCTLPFDFYLPDNNIIIEYDGNHHFYPVTFNNISHERALLLHNTTKKHDSIKNNYCKNHKIRII